MFQPKLSPEEKERRKLERQQAKLAGKGTEKEESTVVKKENKSWDEFISRMREKGALIEED